MNLFTRIGNWRERLRLGSAGIETPRERALLPRAIMAMLEDVLTWENHQLTIGFLVFINIVFIILVQMSISFIELLFIVGMMVTCLDALEMWLRLKHRTACLERLAQGDNARLQNALAHTHQWIGQRFSDFLAMRESNPTKAFLLVNIVLGAILVVGKTISVTLLLYLVVMAILLFPVLSPYVVRIINKIHQVAESDGDIDSLIPELSEKNIKELNFETEAVNTRQSVEPWLPEGAPPEQLSDSDDSHSSDEPLAPPGLAALGALDRDSASSDDEYLPHGEEESPRTTVEVLPEMAPGWGPGAAGALWGLTDAMASLVRRAPLASAHRQKQRVSSTGSSDEFEFVDSTELN